MRKIIKNLAFLVFASLIAVSCDYDETNYDSLLNELDMNSTYYVQFANASKDLTTGVNNDGEIIDIETTIDVVLLGPPQSEAITIDLQLDPSTTIDPSMYTLSASSVTIPAGETSGSVTLTTNTELMPEDETLKLVMNLDAGANNATAGTQINYNLYRIRFCPIDDITIFEGSYSGDTYWGPTQTTATVNANGVLEITGVGVAFMTGYWGEVITNMESIPIVLQPNGDFTIPETYYMSTTYNGAVQPDYNLTGYGRLDACTGTMELYYDFVQPGVLDSYVDYFGSQDYFTEIIVN